MEESIRKARDYDFTSDLALNHFIDAKDTVNNWCVAIVTDILPETQQIKISFEGWSAKYDEVSIIQIS